MREAITAGLIVGSIPIIAIMLVIATLIWRFAKETCPVCGAEVNLFESMMEHYRQMHLRKHL